MRNIVHQAVIIVAAVPALAACSYFGNDAPEKEVNVPPPGRLTTDCARLQPFFGPSDKELTKDQLETGLKTEFAKWDKDGNGELGYLEIQPLNDALREENVGASPVRDWNGDGHVDFQEFASGWRTMFTLCDGNRSKTVSLSELGHSPNVTPPPQAPKPPEGASKNPDRPERPGGSGY